MNKKQIKFQNIQPDISLDNWKDNDCDNIIKSDEILDLDQKLEQ